MPRIMSRVLNLIQPQMESLSHELSKCKDVLYLGRGTSFPLAM
jgi:glucosamine--fructose-6-phosphate aminotransferase (isomerizing)